MMGVLRRPSASLLSCAELISKQEIMITKPLNIPRNKLIQGGERELRLEDAVNLFDAFNILKNSTSIEEENVHFVNNITSVSKEDLNRVHNEYGNKGLYRLIFLAKTNTIEEFKHFYSLIRDNLIFLEFIKKSEVSELLPESQSLVFDNPPIETSPNIDNFYHNVVNPESSKKIFNPGTRPGYVVYGLGGPRILVSHPFKGKGKSTYAVYENSLDVVTSLNSRGYFGTFLFLDNIPGLEYEVNGVPAWLAWFSYAASQSDLVLYVKEHDGEFGESQRMEMEFTPNRVNKKIVEIPSEELRWAKKAEDDLPLINIGPDGGIIGDEEFERLVADQTHASTFIEAYVNAGFPKDRMIRIMEDGSIEEYEKDFAGYVSESEIGNHLIRIINPQNKRQGDGLAQKILNFFR